MPCGKIRQVLDSGSGAWRIPVPRRLCAFARASRWRRTGTDIRSDKAGRWKSAGEMPGTRRCRRVPSVRGSVPRAAICARAAEDGKARQARPDGKRCGGRQVPAARAMYKHAKRPLLAATAMEGTPVSFLCKRGGAIRPCPSRIPCPSRGCPLLSCARKT